MEDGNFLDKKQEMFDDSAFIAEKDLNKYFENNIFRNYLMLYIYFFKFCFKC